MKYYQCFPESGIIETAVSESILGKAVNSNGNRQKNTNQRNQNTDVKCRYDFDFLYTLRSSFMGNGPCPAKI